MRFFGYNVEFRKISEEVDAKLQQVWVENALTDSKINGGISSVESSLSLSAVYRSVAILSDTVATLPIHLFERTANGRKQNSEHPAFKVIKRPNSYLKRFDVMRYLMTSCLLWGNGYIYIERDKKYRPIALYPIHPSTIEPFLSEDKKSLYYRDSKGVLYDSSQFIHIKTLSLNTIKGISPISLHRQNLSLALYAQDYGSKFFSQGGNMSGVFKTPDSLSDDAYNRLKNDLFRRSVGMSNSHIPLLLEGGLSYERISIPPEDAQFIETRKFQKDEIATIFGVPPHMIGSLDRSTNNNIEHQGREFVQYSLMSYIEQIEGELNLKLLRDEEHAKLYYKINTKALLRGDSTQQANLYASMNRMGAMNANEIRALEDMDAYEGGDEYFVQLNMNTIENAKKGAGKTQSDGGTAGQE